MNQFIIPLLDTCDCQFFFRSERSPVPGAQLLQSRAGGALPVAYHRRHSSCFKTSSGAIMGKEQRNEKMSRKPKKDTSPPKGGSPSDRPMAPVTTVIPRGKEKNK
ncbi:hypothetical protein [Comamonas antarctica]|uniref:Uncharacterized protein n=1 Tax=Comamonas antarctica TaxID=2743470 RepID=A0A6N1X0W3_9BURK|nr:hypothetical protein [Comamonas antarctica]QKV51390.1 hypothetical protein HUK68_06955 [Comamonas antarctica]